MFSFSPTFNPLYLAKITVSRFFLCVSQLERSVHRFTTFYSSQHSGRKLNWLYNMSKGELHTNCFKNRYVHILFSSLIYFITSSVLCKQARISCVCCRYTLQASTFQMAVLLQYNTSTTWTIQQLHESTQIKMDFLIQVSNRPIFIIVILLILWLPENKTR